jgi:hypothetical protein
MQTGRSISPKAVELEPKHGADDWEIVNEIVVEQQQHARLSVPPLTARLRYRL